MAQNGAFSYGQPVETAAPIRPRDTSGLSAGAQSAEALAGVFSQIADFGKALGDQQAIDEGKKAGRTAAQSGQPFAPTGRHGLYYSAYDKEGLRVYAQELELTTRQNISRIATENYNDPQAMQKALDSYRAGAEKQVPGELRSGFKLDFETLSRPHVTASANRLLARQAKAADASMTQLGKARAEDARMIGQQIAGIDPASPGGQKLYAEAAAAMAHDYETALAGAAALVREKMITPEEAQLRLVEQMGDSVQNVIVGIFNGTPSQDRAHMLMDYIGGKIKVPVPRLDKSGRVMRDSAGHPMMQMADPNTVLSADQQSKLRSFMSSTLSAETTLIDNAHAQTDRVVRKTQEANNADLLVRMNTPGSGGVTITDLNDMLAHRQISAADYTARKKDIEATDQGHTDPAYYNDLVDRIATGHATYAEISQAPREGSGALDNKDREHLTDKFMKTTGDGPAIYKSHDYQAARAELKAAIVTTGAMFNDPGEQQRLRAAYRELDDRIARGNIQPDDAQAIRSIVDDMVPRYRVIPAIPTNLPMPRFATKRPTTEQEVVDAAQKTIEAWRAGKIDDYTLRQENEVLRQYEQIITRMAQQEQQQVDSDRVNKALRKNR